MDFLNHSFGRGHSTGNSMEPKAELTLPLASIMNVLYAHRFSLMLFVTMTDVLSSVAIMRVKKRLALGSVLGPYELLCIPQFIDIL